MTNLVITNSFDQIGVPPKQVFILWLMLAYLKCHNNYNYYILIYMIDFDWIKLVM